MPRLTTALQVPNPYQENYRKLVRGSIQSKWEDRFRTLVRGLSAPPWKEHYRFHPVRKWELDFAWPDRKIAFEMEGAIWMKGGGGHSHPLGIERDIEKYNAAALMGWAIIRVTGKMLKARTLFQGEGAQIVAAAFKLDPERPANVG